MSESWSYTFRPSPVVVVEERRDRPGGGVVYARWWEGNSGARGLWRKRSLGARVRDPRTERVSPRREQLVLRLGAELHAALADGRDPRTVPLETKEVLTLSAGLRRYLEPGTGAFLTDTEHRRRLVRAARVLEGVLGASIPWRALGPDAGERVWRTLARRAEGDRGRRQAEQVVGLLFAAGEWLRHRRVLERDAGPSPQRRWRRRLIAEWHQIVGAEPGEPERPRYTRPEAQALLRAAARRDIDPRLRLALLVGPELRLGQVVSHVRRSGVDLRLGSGVGFGTIRVPGRATKKGVTVALDATARAALDEALSTGHLRALEAAYRALDRDYPLFPGGRVKGGRYRPADDGIRPMSITVLRACFRHLESVAGVEHVAGRMWYGLRRAVADEAARQGATERVLDQVGGWTSTGVRTQRYLEREAADVRERADRLRLDVRRGLRAPASPDAVADVRNRLNR